MKKSVVPGVALAVVGLGVWFVVQREGELGPESPIFPPREEIWQITMQRFDTDGDLQLSRAEFARYQTPSLRFEDFDQSGDGFISVEELDTQIMRREPRPLMDLKGSSDSMPMLTPDRPVDDRPGRVP
jgi:hypothetical protein